MRARSTFIRPNLLRSACLPLGAARSCAHPCTVLLLQAPFSLFLLTFPPSGVLRHQLLVELSVSNSHAAGGLCILSPPSPHLDLSARATPSPLPAEQNHDLPSLQSVADSESYPIQKSPAHATRRRPAFSTPSRTLPSCHVVPKGASEDAPALNSPPSATREVSPFPPIVLTATPRHRTPNASRARPLSRPDLFRETCSTSSL